MAGRGDRLEDTEEVEPFVRQRADSVPLPVEDINSQQDDFDSYVDFVRAASSGAISPSVPVVSAPVSQEDMVRTWQSQGSPAGSPAPPNLPSVPYVDPNAVVPFSRPEVTYPTVPNPDLRWTNEQGTWPLADMASKMSDSEFEAYLNKLRISLGSAAILSLGAGLGLIGVDLPSFGGSAAESANMKVILEKIAAGTATSQEVAIFRQYAAGPLANAGGVIAKMSPLSGFSIQNLPAWAIPAFWGVTFAASGAITDALRWGFDKVKNFFGVSPTPAQSSRLKELEDLVLSRTYMSNLTPEQRASLWGEYLALKIGHGQSLVPYPYNDLDTVKDEEGELTEWQKYQIGNDQRQYDLSLEREEWDREIDIARFETDLGYKQWLMNQGRMMYFPGQGEYIEDSEGWESYPDDMGLYGYGLEEQGLQEIDPVIEDLNTIEETETKEVDQGDMSYRPYRRRGSVSVGRRYVFSRYPRPGFFPKMTRFGLRYVKRRRY